MSSAQEPLVLGIAAVQRLFESSCERFRQALSESEAAADAVDFTGHMHDLSLSAGRVQALGEALTLLTGDQSWSRRAAEVLRNYLISDLQDT
jgi:sugar (pentulose or hexulose) kinase